MLHTYRKYSGAGILAKTKDCQKGKIVTDIIFLSYRQSDNLISVFVYRSKIIFSRIFPTEKQYNFEFA